MKTPRLNPHALSPADPLRTRRDEEFVDAGFDELGDDTTLEEFILQIDQARIEDAEW